MMRLHEVKVDSLPTPNIDSLSKSVIARYTDVAGSHNSAADSFHITAACQLDVL